MLIECPFCKTQSRIPESKEGAKVRCGECSKVYTAREAGSRGGRGASSSSGEQTTKIAIGIGAVIVLGLIFFLVNSSKKTSVAPVEAAPKEEVTLVDSTGWDSEIVRSVRSVYDAAFAFDEGRLVGMIHGPRLVKSLNAPPPDEDGQAVEGAGLPEWEAMDTGQREILLREVTAEWTRGEGDDVVSQWKPFDGSVVEEDDQTAIVRVKLSGREGDLMLETHSMEWKLARDGQRWKVFSWVRYFSPEELRARAVRRQREVTKVTLSDGSKLYQADPRPLEHLEDTPQDLREAIDAAYARMVDFSLRPVENSRAQKELIEAGKPACPILLTGLYEIEITDHETASKVMLIITALRKITGEYYGYTPDDSMGRSEEHRQASLKAWFAWWLMRGERRFEEKEEGEDALEGLIQPTERDLRQMEADRRKAASEGGG